MIRRGQDITPQTRQKRDRQNIGRWWLAEAAALVVFLTFSAGAMAAPAGQATNYTIASQPLDSALKSFAEQSHIQLMYSPDAVKNLTTKGVQGRHTPEKALEILLDQSGLIYKHTDDKTVIVRKVKESMLRQNNPAAALSARGGTVSTPTETRAGASGGAAAQTQTGEAPSATAIEEIMVTSRKREERLLDTPISVTAFQESTLRAMNITSIDQIGAMTPGLVFDNTTSISGSSASASVFIRGIGQNDFTLVTEPGVGIYIDDVYLSHSIGNVIDALDIERVEVLRGPQGTLFGRNTIGGAVRVVTKKPNENLEGNVEAITGRFNRIDLKMHVNIPLSDNFFMRLSGLTQNRDGFVDRPFLNGKTGDKNLGTFLAQARWLASDDLVVDLSFNYVRDRSNGSPNVLLAARSTGFNATNHNNNIAPGLVAQLGDKAFWGPNQVPSQCCIDFSNLVLDQDLDTWSTAMTVDWQLGAVAIKSISSFRDLKTNFGRDADHSPILLVQVDSFIKLQQWSQEFQFTGTSFDGRLNWLAGFYHFKESGFMDDDVRFSFATLLSGGTVKTRSTAVFGQATLDITDRLDLTGGLRWTDESKKFIIDATHQILTSLFGNPLDPPARIIPEGQFVSKASEVTPYVNLSYHWQEDLMTYVSYSEGFKGGGFQQRNAPSVTQLPIFGPEFAKVVEVGAKTSAFDERLRLSLAGYRTDYSNLQVTVTEGVASVTRNAGTAVIKGFELEAQAVPTADLLIAGGISFIDANYTKLSGNAAEVTLNSKLPKVPKWETNLSVSYTIHTQVGSFTPRADWSYSASLFNDARNSITLRRKARHLVNLSLTFMDRSEAWEAAVFVLNVGDVQVITSGFENVTDYAEGSLSRPREWGVRLRRSF